MENAVEEMMTIGKEKYKVIKCELEQSKLKFFPENPRVYSALNIGDEKPSQEQIEEVMCNDDRIKQLKESIKSNGGLLEPIYVRDGDMVVLEGNSRLAAYRLLFKQDPIKWAKIKVVLLPSDISESAIFSLLGTFHIIGKKDWNPYEQAGYLYRTINNSNKTIEILATELGITTSYIKKLVDVYEYMIEKDDDHPNKWSYYEEMLKNRGIKKAFEEVPGLEDKIVSDIKNNNIRMAIDIRKLGDVSKVNDKLSRKILKDIAMGEEDIYSGYEIVASSGKMDNNFQFITNFRKKIQEDSYADKLLKDDNLNNIEFELKKIDKLVKNMLAKIENSKNK